MGIQPAQDEIVTAAYVGTYMSARSCYFSTCSSVPEAELVVAILSRKEEKKGWNEGIKGQYTI